MTLPPQTLGSVLSGWSLRASFVRTQFSAGSGGGQGFEQCHCVWQRELLLLLDLIRLSEPGERGELRQARETVSIPTQQAFLPVSLPKPLLGWKRPYRLIALLSLLSCPTNDLTCRPPSCPLSPHQPAPKHEVFFSLQLPLLRPCQGRSWAQESSWHPHESPSCRELTWNQKLPTPTALAQGPRTQGHGNLAMVLQGGNSPEPPKRAASVGI